MSYRLSSVSRDSVILNREPYGCTNLILVFVGIPLLVGGVYGIVISLDSEVHYIFLAFAVTFFGLFFTVAGTVVLPAQYRNRPKSIIFNNTKGRMEVAMSDNQTIGLIPYHDIEFVGARTSTDREEGSSYKIFMKKKDGAVWDLMGFESFKKANATFEKIEHAIQLQVESSAVNMTLPQRIHETIAPEKSMIHWRNKLSPAFVLIVLFFIMFSTATGMAIYDLAGRFILALPFAAAALGIFFLIYKMIQTASRQYAVVITPQELSYFEFSTKSGVQKKKKSIPLETIAKVIFQFSTDSVATGLFRIVTHQDIAYQQSVASDQVQAAINSLMNKNQPLLLQVEGINPAECIALEQWIEKQLNRFRISNPVQ